jgi:hypothetical protein
MRISALALSLGLAGLALAQQQDNQQRNLDCEGSRHNDRQVSHCEMKEWTVGATGRIAVDGRQNGGISVKGWSRSDVLVRARLESWADTEGEAQAVVNQIQVQTGGEIRAEGPSQSRGHNWSVSYEVFVPHKTDLSLKAHNGGISIADVGGQIDFDAVNGGVTLKRLAGNVSGHTTNGGLAIELAGNRWDGAQMDVRTTNGGVSMKVPANYSARLETGTVNGGVKLDFPITVQGDIRRNLSVDLGAGGPLVRATTTNGGITIKRL